MNNILNKIFNKSEKSKLLGKWKQVLPIEVDKNIFMEFIDKGLLIYEIHFEGKIAKMQLTYKIDGNKIISDQPSSPKEETTVFKIRNNRLILKFNNLIYEYTKENSFT